ncbi:hypothetical protein ACROYT_G003006 [Oculina patagonica]
MAASETILSSWKTPLSTPIRKDENACRDLFQNSEKLLASAVSICRLKGSVECQTGGLITVCEELQSLIRLAFSEIRRLEKHFNSQRSHFEDEITCLKERVKYLEEGKGGNKHSDNNEDCKEINESTHNNECRRNPSESDENVKDTNGSLPEVDGNLEESDPYLFNTGSADVEEIPVDDALTVPPKEQKASKSPQENQKSKKRLKKPTSNKVTKSTDSVSEVEDLHPVDVSSGVSEVNGDREGLGRRLTSSAEKSLKKKEAEGKKLENKGKVVAEKTVAELQESESEFKAKSKEGKGKAKIKKMKKKESASLEDSDRSSQDQMPTENTNHHKEIKDTKKQKKKRSVDKEEEEELDEVFQEENPGDDVFHLEAEANTKGKKKRDSSVHEKPEGKPNKKLSRNKKSKSSSDDSLPKTGEEKVDGQPEPMEISHKEPRASTAVEMSNQNEKSSKKESATVEDKDEQLGDMSFLINVNSRIALFVADASQEECELQPMTARERNDVYKVTHLYKLRARIGTKTENNLTTVRLSKQADTRMPKPGRVDSLLSELSIAASKEAVRDSPKNQVKRKHSALLEGNEQTVSGCGVVDQVAPPKKKLSKLSRTKKV